MHIQNEYEFYQLPNGISLAHKQVPHTKIAHLAFVLDIGSRDEKPRQNGMAHFWEHLAFKGTQKRRAFHILNYLEAVGGDLDAFTTKEKIFFNASVLDTYAERAFDLLADITFGATFPEKELIKERSVILEEMAMYADTPADSLLDRFDEIMFPNHALGKPILGITETLNAFSRESLQEFIQENLDTKRVIVSSVSSLSMKQISRYFEKYLNHIKPQSSNRKRTNVSDDYQAQQVEMRKNTSQAHCAIGARAYGLHHYLRLPMLMLINILGGSGMTARLNLILREKYGLVYSVDAAASCFMDCGHVCVSFATEPKTLQKAIQLTHKELKTLCTQKLGKIQLHSAKQQFKGQLAMSEESNSGMVLMMGKSLLDYGRVETLHEIFDRIDKISASELMEVSNEIFDVNQLSTIVLQPQNG
ncbi:MAG: insulinase family protein [Cytophagales bacterium]|nr:MAG: insulinase family protein [Cytophagales bacterium]TAF61520.1 MAG: insulinase family protein [Cytophagales bacterium]